MFSLFQGQYLKGRLNCPSCGGRIGAFDFLTNTDCRGGTHNVSPIHIAKNRVDETKSKLQIGPTSKRIPKAQRPEFQVIKTREEVGLPPVVDVTPKLPKLENVITPTPTNCTDDPILLTDQISVGDDLETFGASAIETMQIHGSNNRNCDDKIDCDKLKKSSPKKQKALAANGDATDLPISLSQDSVQNNESHGVPHCSDNKFSVLAPEDQVSTPWPCIFSENSNN